MYNNRWIRFAGWATEQGIKPLGQRATEIASFLFSPLKTHALARKTVKGPA